MLKTYSLFIALLILISGCAQNKTKSLPLTASVDCVAKWQKNDSIRLKISKETETSEGKSNGGAYYYATVKVMDTLSNGYLLSWQNIPPVDFGNEDLQAKMANLFFKLRIIYTTDKKGSFSTIENYDEMQSLVESTMQEVNAARADKTDKATLDKQMEQVKAMFSSRESVDQLMGRDIQMFHGAYSGTFKTRPDTTHAQRTLPVGRQQSIPALLITSLKELNDQKKTAVVSINQQIDSKEAAKAMNDFLVETLRISGQELKPEEVVTKYAVQDSAAYTYDLSTGWINHLYARRTGNIEYASAKTSRQTQITRIALR